MLIHDALRLSAQRRPDRAALIWKDEPQTFAHLYERVRRCASWVLSIAPAGSRIALLSANSPEVLEACYAVPMAGCILVLLNYRLNAAELAQVVLDSGAQVLMHDAGLAGLAQSIDVPAVKARVEFGSGMDCAYERGLAQAAPLAPSDAARDEQAVAWLVYTSGTTGLPKGVMLTHRNLVRSVCNSAMAWPVAESDVMSLASPLCHISAYFVPLFHLQAAAILLHQGTDAAEILRGVETWRVTHLLMPAKDKLLDCPALAGTDCSSVRAIAYGGGMTPPDQLRRLRERFGTVLLQQYGMTESAGNVALLHAEEHAVVNPDGDMTNLPTGRCMPLCEIRIADDDGQEVPIGDVGEVWIAGEQVAVGYWNQPEATRSVFGGGWLRTGDMARREAGGFFTVVDRKKDMIKTGGQNVVSQEVEAVLAAHPDVAEATVIGLPDPRWGETVTALVVLRPGAGRDGADYPGLLIEHCRERLARFKCPKRVLLVDALPKNATGKVLKRELRMQMSTR